MDIKDLLKLVDAGFTPAQIEKLVGESVKEPEDPAPEPDLAPAPEPDPAPAPKQDPAPTPAQNIQQASNQALLNELKELRLAIQAQNIRQGGPGPQKETVEEVLASIIAP